MPKVSKEQKQEQKQDQKPAQAFDLSSRYMAETLDVPIMDTLVDPTQETGMVWTITSQFSKQARNAALAATKVRLDTKGNVVADAVADFDDSLIEQLVAVTLSWRGVTVNGEPLACTPENVRALLTDERTAWMRPQVQAAYLSLSRFFTKASAH